MCSLTSKMRKQIQILVAVAIAAALYGHADAARLHRHRRAACSVDETIGLTGSCMPVDCASVYPPPLNKGFFNATSHLCETWTVCSGVLQLNTTTNACVEPTLVIPTQSAAATTAFPASSVARAASLSSSILATEKPVVQTVASSCLFLSSTCGKDATDGETSTAWVADPSAANQTLTATFNASLVLSAVAVWVDPAYPDIPREMRLLGPADSVVGTLALVSSGPAYQFFNVYSSPSALSFSLRIVATFKTALPIVVNEVHFFGVYTTTTTTTTTTTATSTTTTTIMTTTTTSTSTKTSSTTAGAGGSTSSQAGAVTTPSLGGTATTTTQAVPTSTASTLMPTLSFTKTFTLTSDDTFSDDTWVVPPVSECECLHGTKSRLASGVCVCVCDDGWTTVSGSQDVLQVRIFCNTKMASETSGSVSSEDRARTIVLLCIVFLVCLRVAICFICWIRRKCCCSENSRTDERVGNAKRSSKLLCCCFGLCCWTPCMGSESGCARNSRYRGSKSATRPRQQQQQQPKKTTWSTSGFSELESPAPAPFPRLRNDSSSSWTMMPSLQLTQLSQFMEREPTPTPADNNIYEYDDTYGPMMDFEASFDGDYIQIEDSFER